MNLKKFGTYTDYFLVCVHSKSQVLSTSAKTEKISNKLGIFSVQPEVKINKNLDID